jgi:hypothetical protein
MVSSKQRAKMWVIAVGEDGEYKIAGLTHPERPRKELADLKEWS